MPEKEERILYFGFDESNHAGPDRKGEIVSVTASQNRLDSIVKDFPNTRNYEMFENWLKQYPGNDYRFTILMGDKYRYRASSSNLIEAIPMLIAQFIPSEVDCIKLYLDGRLSKEEKGFLRNYFSNQEKTSITKVIVDNFIKKTSKNNKRFRKGPHCPKLVYLADVIANNLLSLDAQTLLSHPNFIPMP